MRVRLIASLLALVVSTASAYTYQQQTVKTAVTQFPQTAVTSSALRTNPVEDYIWNQASDVPEFGTFGQAMNLVLGASVGSDVLSISSTAFSEAKIENNNNTDVWATTSRGSIEFEFRYSTFAGSAVLFFLDGKSAGGSGPFDSDDGVQIRTVVPVSDPGVFIRYVGNNGSTNTNSSNVVFSGAASTWFLVRAQWNRSAARTVQIQIGDNPGGYSATVPALTKCDAWHQVLPGNDSGTSFAHDQRRHRISPNWTYDMCSTVWQDFEFTTVDQASLESRDHNSTQAWALTGTTSRFVTDAAGAFTMPCQINFQTGTSTKGLRNDLNATAQANIGITFSATTTAVVYGAWVKSAALTTNTSAPVMFAGNTSTSSVAGLDQKDTGGQETFILRRFDGTTSSAINISADTWYWVSILAQRNATCRLNVYDSSGALVGSVSDLTGQNASINSIRIGSEGTTTSQSAGVYHYMNGFCYDFLSLVFPFKPWP